MSQRLPTPGADDNQWGDILNSFLVVSLNNDGTLQSSAMINAGGEMTANKNQLNGYAGLDSNSIIQMTAVGAGMNVGINYPTSAEDIQIGSAHLQYPLSNNNYYTRTTLGSAISWNGTAWALDTGTGDFVLLRHGNTWGGYVSNTYTSGFAIYTGYFSTAPASLTDTQMASYQRMRINEVGTTTFSNGSNFAINRSGVMPGTVTTNGTTTLTGSNTDFTETFKVGDTITVTGETVRTISAIASTTSLTVTVAFSTSVSGLSYTATTIYPLIVRANGTVVTGGSLTVGGPIASAFSNKTSAYTLTNTDSVVSADATSAAFSITLPTAVGITGQQYTIKRINGNANTVTVATTSSQTIDGATTYALSAQYSTVTVVSNNANWLIVSKI